MKVSIILATAGLAAAWPSFQLSTLSPCYYGPDLCTCASGTSFAVSHTTFIVGAAEADFYNVAGDFFGIAWEGLTTNSTTGIDNVPGATRNTTVPAPTGNYLVTEKLTRHTRVPGYFNMQFEQANYPVPFKNGQGSFAGYWVTFQGTAIGKAETFVDWKINSCFTGEAFNFTAFKEGSLSNAAAILKSSGKLTGTSIGPVTTKTQ